MRYIIIAILFVLLVLSASADAHADWRWAKPDLPKAKVTFYCDSIQCIKSAYLRAKHKHKVRVNKYNARKLKEWKNWTSQPIADCTWYGESGFGELSEFAPARYVVMNSQGSGARGKYQMMQTTYEDNAKYYDWTPLDQEIAGHGEYYKHGTAPWEAC